MAGEDFETPRMKGALVYLDEDAGARYRFEMLVDLDNDVGERTSTNNYALLPDWYFLSPGSRDTGAFVLDTPAYRVRDFTQACEVALA